MRKEEIDLKWWYLAFKIKQPPPDKGVAYPYIDLLLAHKVVKPLIDKYSMDLKSWHFHRRWKLDDVGHLFCFYFRCENSIKDRMSHEIENNTSTRILKDLNIILSIECNEKEPNKKDIYTWGEWPKSVNINFPLFVHSISKMWLDLIDEIKDFIPVSSPEPETFEELQIFYQQIEANLNNEWLYRGAQFTYHHVSGVFGYSPTMISPDKIRGYLISL